MGKVRAIPEGYHSLTPFFNLKNADKVIDFLKKAFGAEERARMTDPSGKVMHAELKIGDSILMLAEAMQMPEMPSNLHLYVENADAAFERAVAAGAQVVMPLSDQFWGDRYGRLSDPFGNQWSIGTHKEDVSMEEMRKRAAALFAHK
jgi:PhnB protein